MAEFAPQATPPVIGRKGLYRFLVLVVPNQVDEGNGVGYNKFNQRCLSFRSGLRRERSAERRDPGHIGSQGMDKNNEGEWLALCGEPLRH